MSGNGYAFVRPESIEKLAAVKLLIDQYGSYGIRSDGIGSMLGIAQETVGNYLTELKRRGQAHMRRIGTGAKWYPGPPPGGVKPQQPIDRERKCHMPTQSTVSEWTPNNARDPLTAALFGPEPGRAE